MSSQEYDETKLSIPFPSASSPTTHLSGILHQKKQPSQPTSQAGPRTRPLVLILHGVLAHKDQTYHRLLAKRLDVDSLRFDFRGNGESGGEWGMADYENDIEDLDTVFQYLKEKMPTYRVELVVGHSRGALVGWRFWAERGTSQQVPYWVALSGRWRMDRIHDRDPVYNPAFEKQGFYEWKVRVMGQPKTVHVRPSDVSKFEHYPIESYVSRFPSEQDVLLVQGSSDQTVPTADCGYYINTLNAMRRRNNSTNLRLIDEADHNFKGHYDEVVDVVTAWYTRRREMAKQGNKDVSPIALAQQQQQGGGFGKGRL